MPKVDNVIAKISRAFNRRSSLDIDGAIASHKFDLFWNQMTSSVVSSILIYISIITIRWCICPLNQPMNDDIFLLCQLQRTLFLFHLRGIYREDFEVALWRHRWRHHHNCFFISDVKSKLCSIFDIFKIAGVLRSWHTFCQKWFRKLKMSPWLPRAFLILWAINQLPSLNIDGAIAIQNFKIFWNLVTSYIKLLYIKLSQMTSSRRKNLFGSNFGRSFHIRYKIGP